MRGPSMTSLWPFLQEARAGGASVSVLSSLLRGWGAVEGADQQILRLRSFSSGAGKGTSSSNDPSSSADQKEEKKIELGRWWQAFSEKTLPKGENKQSTSKQSLSKWLLPGKDKEGGLSEEERQEITRKQVDARWRASQEKSSLQEKSTEKELSDLGVHIPWFGSSKETSTSDRERLEVSMQRLALMSKLGDKSQAPDFMFLPPKDKLLRKYFQWDNLSSAEKHHINLAKVRGEFQMHKTDCGSSQVQIAQLTTKIIYMTKHMHTHKKDCHSRKGLEAMVHQRPANPQIFTS